MANAPAKKTAAKNKAKTNGQPAFDDAAFNQKLGQFQDDYSTASTDSSYQPPPGDYVCTLIDIRKGEYTPKEGKKGAGQTHLMACPVFEINSDLEGDDGLAGARFDIFCSTATLGILKSTFASINGEIVDDLQLALQEAQENAIGAQFHIAVTENRKNPDYPNKRIKERYAAAE